MQALPGTQEASLRTPHERFQQVVELFERSHRDMGLQLLVTRDPYSATRSYANFLYSLIETTCKGALPLPDAARFARYVLDRMLQRPDMEAVSRGEWHQFFDLRNPGGAPIGFEEFGASNVDDMLGTMAYAWFGASCTRFLKSLETTPTWRQALAMHLRPVPYVVEVIKEVAPPSAPGAPEYVPPPAPSYPPPVPPQYRGEEVEVTRAAQPERPAQAVGVMALPPPRQAPAPGAEVVRAEVPAAPPAQPSPTLGERPAAPRRQVSLFGEAVRAAGVAMPSIAAQLEDKYRPLHLGEILGNEQTIQSLQAAVDSGNFSKAYLIVGRPGTGKTSAVAAAIRDYLDKVAPGELYNPTYAPEDKQMGISPMVLIRFTPLELAKMGAGNLIDSIARFVRSGGMLGGNLRRHVVLDDITRLSPEAQEVLLPLTERYPRVTFWFLANSENFTPQLHSRFREYRWAVPSAELVEFRLLHIIQQEHMPFTNPAEITHQITQELGSKGMYGDFRQAIILLADKARVAGWRPT